MITFLVIFTVSNRNNLLIKLKRSNKENYKIDFNFCAYVRCDTIITVLTSLSKRRSAVNNIRRNDSGVFYDFRSLSANDTRSRNTRLLSFSWKFLQLSNCIQRQYNKSTFDLKERRERKRKKTKRREIVGNRRKISEFTSAIVYYDSLLVNQGKRS